MSGFTFPLAFPTYTGVKGIVIRPRKVVGVNTSPGSLVSQVYEWPGERWEADVSLPLMNRAAAEQWAAWMLSLRGPVGSFLMGDPAGTTPRGAAATTPGTPQVDGAQAALLRTLAIKTGLGTTANYLRAGDWISLSTGSTRRLHKVLADASLSSAGKVTLDIWPALRVAVTDSATIYVSSTTGRFMLTGAALDMSIDTASIYQPAVMGCIEDLRS